MKNPPVIFGSFTIERAYAASPARVFAAWSDAELKARWFIGPPERWQIVQRELDLSVGGREILEGRLTNGTTTLFTARYHAIVPQERLVYAYDMHLNGKHFSVSLATVEWAPARGGGTRMTFTEQAAFFNGEDGTRSREEGTAAHFDRLSPVVDDPTEIVSSRLFAAPRERLYAAFSDPRRLASWWGPQDFKNTFETFELRPGGAWRFVMHGPDGTDYPNTCEFVEVTPHQRIVFRHEEPMHDFTMNMSFLDIAGQTLLTWRMRFESPADAAKVRALVSTANEQNFDRLEALLARGD